MMVIAITAAIFILSVACALAMLFKWSRAPAEPLSWTQYCKLSISGVIAFISDTIGVGSFAINVVLAKLLGTFQDDEMPAVNNGAQVIPGTIESLFFLQMIDVDVTTLLTLVAGTCVGGVIGGLVVSRLSKQAVRLAMMGAFSLIILLLSANQLHLLPLGGNLTALPSSMLVVGFFAMMLCGALTSVGVGLFVMVQATLFLLNVSPVVAFPIMTTAGAMQQPLTTMVFLQQNKIPLKKTMILSLSGCVGVVITLSVFKYITVSWLHTLLLFILIYNLIAVSRTFLRTKREVASELDDSSNLLAETK